MTTPRPFELGARLTLVLDPAGRVRSVAEVSGVGAPPTEFFIGRTLPEIADQRDHGTGRAEEWERRLMVARETSSAAHYADPPPGASPDAPASVDCAVTPIRGDDGSLHSILVDIHDRTSLVETQRLLRRSEERFRLLAESLPQMVWVGTGADEVQYFSGRWQHFTGRTNAELLGRGYEDLIHPDDLQPLRDNARDMSAKGRPLVFRMRRHDGEYRWLESYVAYLFGDDGTVLMAVGGTTDVTDRLADEALHLHSEKREAIGTLAGGIAHDFNNVIGAILSNASLAQAEIAAGDSPSTSVSEIARGAVRASDLVRRMLEYSREDEPASEQVAVGEVAREACGLLQATLPATVSLERSIEASVPPVLGDASQLHRVVMHLVTNARQSIGDTGTGTISVLVDLVDVPGRDGAHRSAELPDGAYVRLRVRDDGPGMAEAVRQRALDPFFTTKPAGEGTGLGLAAVQTIARRHDGWVGVESTEGEGTTVTALLPAVAAREAETEAEAEPAVVTTSRETPRVAFVDDEPSLTMLADRALPLYGCDPVVFTDAREAREAILADPSGFDALITDHSMPGLTGIELVAELRTVLPDLPTVLTSGFLTPAHREAARVARVDTIISKPCSIEELANAARALIG